MVFVGTGRDHIITHKPFQRNMGFFTENEKRGAPKERHRLAQAARPGNN